MESRLGWFRNTLGVICGLAVGLAVVNPVALKAISMLPVISIVTPGQNQEVSGQVSFFAAADSEGIVSLRFQVDGQNVGNEVTSGYCTANWDTTQATDGLHTVQAIARDLNGTTIPSQPVTVRVNNFVPPPPTTPPPTTPPPTTPPPTTPPPTTPPPTTPPPTPPVDANVAILSPAINAVLSGTVPVSVAVPAQTSEVWVQLKDLWGSTVTSWGGAVSPGAASATVQVNAGLGAVATANYNLVAVAVVNGQQVSSAPVPVRIENTNVPPPTTPPPTIPPPTPPTSPGTPAPPTSIRQTVFRAPSRIKTPTARGVESTQTPTPSQSRPEARSTDTARAASRSSSAASQTQSGFLGAGRTQKSTTAPAKPNSGGTALPPGTVVTIGLGPCTGTDPYAKHPTLKGECVSGTWFPRVRKAEPRKQ